MKLIITRGLPASGKSTRARAWVSEDPANRAEVNRDSIRAMLHGGFANAEVMVTEVSHSAIKSLLNKGVSVVCSDTNLPQKNLRELAKIGWSCGAEVEIWDMTDVSLQVCLDRNDKRQDKEPVPVDAINSMYERFIQGRKYPLPLPDKDAGTVPDLYRMPDPNAPFIDICDIDGTVAEMNGRSPYDYSLVSTDRPKLKIIHMLKGRYAQNREIIFVSGRPESCRGDTEAWLRFHLGFPFEHLYMRATGDNRNDAIVKREIFDTHIRFKYNVSLVFDDRDRVVRMWREELGLTCLQVAPGNF